MSQKLLLTAALTALTLSACAVGPTYTRPPEVPFAAQWLETGHSAAPEDAWWRSLHDPLLDDLVERTLQHNRDLKVAEAHLREARASRDATAGQRLPQVDLTGSATANRLSKNGEIPIDHLPGFKRDLSLYDVGFDASWEIDLWGHQARAVEGATAREQAAAEALHDVQVSLIAEVVRSYVELRSAQEQLASATADAEAQESIARLTGERFEGGESSRFDYARAEAQALSTRAAVPGFSAAAHAAAYQLAVLTGQPPEALTSLLETPAQVPRSPAVSSAGLRSDLLRRRPDVRQAERQLAAATADVGVATSELFPRLSLVGTYGQQAQNASDLFSAGSNRFSVGPSLHWPVFAGGTIRANIRASNARADAAAATYEGAVLRALGDSETAINRFAAAQRTQQDREVARLQSEEALGMARQRYRAGEDDLIVLLDAQSAYTVADQQSIAARAATLEALASMYKALGGGWQSAATAPVAARESCAAARC
ncbi:MAG: efflux transporter outer membrane subunit [Proteobacteria bacterium]|nr:efflux transporter outer membrane subunit [Pseudomonadota bacterium]